MVYSIKAKNANFEIEVQADDVKTLEELVNRTVKKFMRGQGGAIASDPF